MPDEQNGFEDWLARAVAWCYRYTLWPLLAMLFLIAADATLHLIVQGSVNAQLGFDYATPQLKWNDEPFLITRVDAGGVMERAGLRVDDRMMLDDVSKLYALLIRSQGGAVGVLIVRDGQARIVVVRVPQMRLPFSAGVRRLLYGRYWAGVGGASSVPLSLPRVAS